MSGLDLFIWALLIGYLVARHRLHQHLKNKRRAR
jgi:hypothetical protein